MEKKSLIETKLSFEKVETESIRSILILSIKEVFFNTIFKYKMILKGTSRSILPISDVDLIYSDFVLMIKSIFRLFDIKYDEDKLNKRLFLLIIEALETVKQINFNSIINELDLYDLEEVLYDFSFKILKEFNIV